MSTQEKRFLDQAGLKQALTLIKNLIASTKVELMTEINSVSNGGGSALTEAKAELTAKDETLDNKIDTAAAAAATNLATAETNLNSTINSTKTALEAADTALDNKIAANKTAAETALATAKSELETTIATNKTACETALANAKTEFDTKLANAQLKFQVVETLPALAEADPRVVYLIKDTQAGTTADADNKYIEYLVQVENGVNTRFEEIGDTQMSLVDYDKIADVNDKIAVAKSEALDAVEQANYVRSQSYITDLEVIALFEDAPLVANVDGTYTKYDTPVEAIAAATVGQTVVLNKDVTVASNVTIADGVTIDLNGFELKVQE